MLVTLLCGRPRQAGSLLRRWRPGCSDMVDAHAHAYTTEARTKLLQLVRERRGRRACRGQPLVRIDVLCAMQGALEPRLHLAITSRML